MTDAPRRLATDGTTHSNLEGCAGGDDPPRVPDTTDATADAMPEVPRAAERGRRVPVARLRARGRLVGRLQNLVGFRR